MGQSNLINKPETQYKQHNIKSKSWEEGTQIQGSFTIW
jgi:hypothetical protein